MPKNINLKNHNTRDILSNAVIIRNLYNENKTICKSKKLCHKIKKFNDKDNLEINSFEDAKNFIESI